VEEGLVLRDESYALWKELELTGALTATGLDLSSRPDLGYDELEALAAFFGHINEVSKWALFDTLLTIEARHGELVAQAAEVTGRQPQTIENGMSIARRIPRSRRRDGVTFTTHGEVASLAPNDQRRWLKIAAEDRLTKDELRSRITAERNGTPDFLPPPEVCPACHRPL
jgi:hypothetical protein